MRANLKGVNLEGADLRWAYLSGANLIEANLSGADLRSAYLIEANLIGAKGFFKTEKNLLTKVAKHALADNKALDMSTWHTCNTTHCIAGWTCYLAQDKSLEEKYGTALAAQMLLGLTNNGIFYADNNQAIEFLKQQLK